jgi:ComF family protein
MLPSFIVDFFFPLNCLGCDVEKTLLCESCLNTIPLSPIQRCPGCSIPSQNGVCCPRCALNWSLDGLYVMSVYSKESLLQTAIQFMKYKNGQSLCTRFGEWLSGSDLKFSKFMISPVPLHTSREKTRGYNQSFLIAHSLSRYTNAPLQKLLTRARSTPPQAQLSRKNRLTNLANAFEVTTMPSSSPILLIDDVCSTGATLNECARVLKENGASNVWGLVLARG